jgi:hypothetical protein
MLIKKEGKENAKNRVFISEAGPNLKSSTVYGGVGDGDGWDDTGVFGYVTQI